MRSLALAVAGVLVFFADVASGLDISNRYRSPRNPERKVRASTELIVLHTTEAPANSSLNKLCDRGEAHYCVTEEGRIYRIVDRDREAFHAGRSMWNGKEDVDKFSIGIECVGYHDKPMSAVQLKAIADLVSELKKMYRIPDQCVVAHSHVAYGAPNRWHKKRHRGRKQCGMLFAMPSVRRVLGLAARPARDNDTRAGRLVIGDPYLNNVLYGNIDTMKPYVGRYAIAPPKKEETSWFAKIFGKSTDAKKETPRSAVARRKPNAAPKKSANTRPKFAAAKAPPKTIAELRAQGYKVRGIISKTRTASSIAGARWNAADTYYTIRGKVISGKAVDAAHLEKGMSVWMK